MPVERSRNAIVLHDCWTVPLYFDGLAVNFPAQFTIFIIC